MRPIGGEAVAGLAAESGRHASRPSIGCSDSGLVTKSHREGSSYNGPGGKDQELCGV